MFAHMSRFSAHIFALMAIFMMWTHAVVAQTTENTGAYALGPMDEISLRVVVWDNDQLTFTDLGAISGTYRIAPDGSVMLPIIGSLQAAAVDINTLADQIAVELQSRTGRSEEPSVAIEVSNFRPVFVLGDIERPGEYPFQPGMRAMQLIATAGGYFRGPPSNIRALLRDGLRVDGLLREIETELATARIRESRLRAEASGNTSFVRPENLVHPDGPEALRMIFSNEQRIFEAQLEALEREVASLESSRALLERETLTLAEKQTGIAQQVEMMALAVGNLESLLEQGLTRSPTLLNTQRTLLELQSRQLDIESQLFRAQQAISGVDRDLNAIKQRYSGEALTQLQAVNSQISQLETRRRTQQDVLAETSDEIGLYDTTAATEQETILYITRDIDGSPVTEIADPTTVLLPLDVLEIRQETPEIPANP